MHYLGACAVARRVRSLAPHLPIVIGGHHATAAPDDFTHDLCDWVVRGDGEQPLRALCQQWPRRPAQLTVVEGGVFDQSSSAHIDWDRYGRPEARDHAVWVGLSRGCPFQCRFCVEPQRGTASSRYSVDDALSIVERLARTHAPRVICFSDPLFGTNRRWTEAFLDGLERRELPLMFWAENRADLMTPELLDRFKRCRFKLDFGLDAASVTMVERMEKSPDAERYLARSRELLRHANAIGLPHGIYLIFNFPGETPATSRQAQKFIDGIAPGPRIDERVALVRVLLHPARDQRVSSHGRERGHLWDEDPPPTLVDGSRRPLRPGHGRAAEPRFRGREDQLRAFESWNQGVNDGWVARYPAEVTEFCQAFYRRSAGETLTDANVDGQLQKIPGWTTPITRSSGGGRSQSPHNGGARNEPWDRRARRHAEARHP